MTTRIQKVKVFAIITLALLSLVVMVAAPMFRAIPEIRIDPWEVEIPTPWERVEVTELTELSEAEVPEWYISHGELNPAEAKAIEQYETAYPEMEVGEEAVPCTVNGVKGIVYKEKGQIFINLGPVKKRIG